MLSIEIWRHFEFHTAFLLCTAVKEVDFQYEMHNIFLHLIIQMNNFLEQHENFI